MNHPKRKIIACPPKLIVRRRVSGMGTSPAVLTNAVWALTHKKKPVVPDDFTRGSWRGKNGII